MAKGKNKQQQRSNHNPNKANSNPTLNQNSEREVESVPSITEMKRMSWKEFYERTTSFIYTSVDVKPGQTQAWWDYVRFYNGIAVMFPEKCSDLVIFERKIAEKSGATLDEYTVIENTLENQNKFLLSAYPSEYTAESIKEPEVQIGIGIADDPTLGVDVPPEDVNSSQATLPGANINPNAGKQYPPIPESELKPTHIEVDQLTKDGLPNSV